jgi:hypothetical protein
MHQDIEQLPQDRRARHFTDADLERLADILAEKHPKVCRFPTIDPVVLAESLKFYQNLNKFFDESKHTIWRTFLATGVGALMLIIVLGVIAKAKEMMGLGQ